MDQHQRNISSTRTPICMTCVQSAISTFFNKIEEKKKLTVSYKNRSSTINFSLKAVQL
jgi:hypothetical protein